MLEVKNPVTGKIIQTLESDTPLTIKEKVKKAHDAQFEWEATPFKEKQEIISSWRVLLKENLEHLALTLTQETGKPIRQSRNEILGTLSRIDFFLKEVGKFLTETSVYQDPDSHLIETLTNEPLGVIANISAWNYPYFVGSNVFLPALLTGNAVLYKPSEYATLTGLKITHLLHEAGVPKSIFSCIVGKGDAGVSLLESQIDGVFFTGSYQTGKKIAEKVAPKLIPLQLELGGKDPTYVCEDVQVKKAAEALADGAFYNCGQSCCSVERIYVHEKVHETFVQEFVKVVLSFQIGNPELEETYIGPLTRKEQIPFLEEQIQDAVKKGAKVLVGGKRSNKGDHYFEPSVLTGVDHSMKLMTEESFGPVIGIAKVASDEEAIQKMNDSEYGLTAGVFTTNELRAKKILKRLKAGSVYWNCSDRVSPRLPWSGRKGSGLGATLGDLGIQAFLKPKAWHLKNSL